MYQMVLLAQMKRLSVKTQRFSVFETCSTVVYREFLSLLFSLFLFFKSIILLVSLNKF